MVSASGADRHVHGISRFELNVVAPVILDVHGTTFIGLTEISTDGNVTWHNVQTTVTIARQDAIRIAFDGGSTDNHFSGQQIYGVVYGIQKYYPQCCFRTMLFYSKVS